jgi:hypothetical protein
MFHTLTPGGRNLKIFLNEAQSKILIDIVLKDVLPKELAKRRKQLEGEYYKGASVQQKARPGD